MLRRDWLRVTARGMTVRLLSVFGYIPGYTLVQTIEKDVSQS